MRRQKRNNSGVSLTQNFQAKQKRFQWVKSYIVNCFNDGTAFEDPIGFREDINQFIEPIIADQIEAIQQMADMERELLKRDARILQLETQISYERSLTDTFRRMEDDFDRYLNNPEEHELLKEIRTLCSMEITEENAAEHNRRMRIALQKANTVLDPETRRDQLKSTMNKAIFGVRGRYNDEMIMPLRRHGLSREQREAKFSDWLSRHYDI